MSEGLISLVYHKSFYGFVGFSRQCSETADFGAAEVFCGSIWSRVKTRRVLYNYNDCKDSKTKTKNNNNNKHYNISVTADPDVA